MTFTETGNVDRNTLLAELDTIPWQVINELVTVDKEVDFISETLLLLHNACAIDHEDFQHSRKH